MGRREDGGVGQGTLYKVYPFEFLYRVLSKYYQSQRSADIRNCARTTIRLLESLIRLAQAHARLMFRNTVTVQDAVMAVSLIECSMQSTAILGSTNILRTKFPDDCKAEYKKQAELILNALGLSNILEKELSS